MIYHDVLMDICKRTKKLYYLSETSDLLLTYAAKMPEELENRRKIIEQISEEQLEGLEEKELNYTVLHLTLMAIFVSTKAKDKQKTIDNKDLIIKIMRHHQMHEYAVINFEIIISLLLFSLDPDIVDQGRLFEMKREFMKIGDYADDPSKT